jgi:hypothetical protein
MMTSPLKLNEFKHLYRRASGWPVPIRFLFLGFLVWLEERYIAYKATSAVDTALEALDKEPVVVAPPIYTETPPSPSSGGLPSELRLRAPWVQEEKAP